MGTDLERFSTLLRGADPRDRLRGVRELSRLSRALAPEDRERAATLLAPLASDPEPFVRWNVALAASLLGGEGALDLLRGEAQVADEHANTRFRVALSLGFLADPRGLPVLDRYVEDPYTIGEHAVVRAFAALALGMVGDPAGIPALARLAVDQDPVVRWHVAVALGDIGHPDGRPVRTGPRRHRPRPGRRPKGPRGGGAPDERRDPSGGRWPAGPCRASRPSWSDASLAPGAGAAPRETTGGAGDLLEAMSMGAGFTPGGSALQRQAAAGRHCRGPINDSSVIPGRRAHREPRYEEGKDREASRDVHSRAAED